MKNSFTNFIAVMALALTTNALAGSSRNVTLQLARTNQNQVVISWQSQTAVPAPGLQLVPDFQVEKSSDLMNWTPVGSKITGAANNQSQRAFDSVTNPAVLYRVKSIVDRANKELNQVNLSNGDLVQANFFGTKFFAANLTGANLTGADFRAADLRFATFTDATANGANFFAADMSMSVNQFAFMENADLSFANLEGADLFGASLEGSDLRSAILINGDLRFATLKGMLIDSRTMLDSKWVKVWQLVNNQATNSVFTNLDFSIADLRSANMQFKNFSGSDFSSSSLAGADLRNANFTNANLRFVVFNSTLMDATTIIEAKSRLVWEILNQGAVNRDLHGTNLSNAFLVSADMRGVNLTNTTMTLAVMEFANLGGGKLQNVNLSGADCFKTIFTNAALNSANFSGADLTQANFFGATTNGANFSGATFFQTIMPNGAIRNF